MIELTPEQRRALRAAAHHLNPVVTIAGKGLADTVIKEIDRSLKAHELIKVKLAGIEREARNELLAEICERLACAPVQHIGNTLILWRENPEERENSGVVTRVSQKSLTKKQAAAASEKPRPAPTRRRT